MEPLSQRRRVSALVACVAAALALCAGGLRAAERMHGPPGHELEDGKRLQELSQDISTINLLNGLRLTREQTEALLRLAREADKLRTSGPHTRFYRKALREAITAYEAFKTEAIKGEPPAGPLSHRAVRHEHRVQGIRNRRAMLLDDRSAELDRKLRGILTEGQLEIVETFKPCLVPPRDLKDPVRAGQVAGDRGVRMLSHLRGLPGEAWRSHKADIAEHHVRKAIEGMHLEITKAEARKAQKERFIGIVEKARAMSDVEYGMEKGKLAAQLSPQESRRELFERSRVVRGKGRPQKISAAVRWLVHPRIIPILAERLKAGTAFKAAPGAADEASGATCR